MLKKTINKVIAKKMDSWIRSIKGEEFREDVKGSIVVTGGCIASMLLGEDVNDFDIYFDDESVLEKLCQYYLKESNARDDIEVQFSEGRVKCVVPSAGFVNFNVKKDEKEYKLAYLTDNAMTFNHDIQVVTRFVGDAAKLHENYDYIHATNYWTYKTGLVTNLPAMESLISKSLHYSGSKYPLCSILRAKKFINRGWKINAGQYLKMCMQLNELNLRDINVLKEQLVGVDSAYFNHFLTLIAEKDMKEVEMTYVMELIDQVFEN